MSESMLEPLHRVPLFAWLPKEGAEALSDCFDLRVEEPPAGETLPTGGQIGCLLRGEASFQWDGGERTLSEGSCLPWGRTAGRWFPAC